jgi:hypothetical protein
MLKQPQHITTRESQYPSCPQRVHRKSGSKMIRSVGSFTACASLLLDNWGTSTVQAYEAPTCDRTCGTDTP